MKTQKNKIEEWREIIEGYYVSNYGQVKSCNYRNTGKESLLKISNCGNYKAVNIKGKLCYVHRLVATAFIPNPENKTDVNHIDCDTHNNSVDNLEWVSRNENIQKYFNSEKYHKIKTSDRVYYMAKKDETRREYDLIVGSGKARNIETGELRAVTELLAEGYTIRCQLIEKE